jgi:CheY-like chemotaxis protein
MGGEGRTILVVDDEQDTVEFIKAIISEMGDYDVISAFDGETGLEKARTEFPDLIILDVVMSKKDGFSVFSHLIRDPRTEEIPVIMLTAVSQRTGISFSALDMREFFGKEPADYIEKPINPEKLQNAIRKILGK